MAKMKASWPSPKVRCRGLLRLCLSGLILTAVASGELAAQNKEPLRVAVGIEPIAYFVEQIGGDRVDVQVILAAGHSPATYDPTPRQMAQLADADIYFQVGVPFEKQLASTARGTFPNLKIVNLSPAQVRGIPAEVSDGHEHEDDPHYWLDPGLMIEVADTICHRLVSISSEDHQRFTSNLAALVTELKQADSSIAARLRPYRGRELWVFHPAFGHFAAAYGLKQVALEHEGKEPGMKQMAMMDEHARRENIAAIFVQPQFSTNTAETFAAEIGARVVLLDPLARNYIDNLLHMAEEIAAAMGD